MAETQEDLNAFDSWDSAGAVLTLGVAPVVASYIFFRDMPWLMFLFGAAAVGLAALVFMLSKLTGWRIIGSTVNLVGCILVPAYLVAAIYLWTSPYAPTARYHQDEADKKPAAAAQPEEQGEPSPAPSQN